MSLLLIKACRLCVFAFLMMISPGSVLASGGASEDATGDCQSIKAPYVIQSSGCYVVAEDFSASKSNQFAVVVRAQNVVLDLGGNHMKGPGAGSTSAGIQFIGGESVVIRNGTISGFLYGIRIDPLKDDFIDRVTVDNITIAGGTARGIFARADNVKISNSNVFNLTGYKGWPASFTIAIEVRVKVCEIFRNKINEIYPEGVGEAIGISVSEPVDKCSIFDNSVTNSKQPEFGRGIAFWVDGNQARQPKHSMSIQNNMVAGYAYGFMTQGVDKEQVKSNQASLDCGIDDVVLHLDITTNSVSKNDRGCRDTLTYLRKRAEDGGAQWKLRLVAALLERQWALDSSYEAACPNFREANEVLAPLLKNGVDGAQEQQTRLDQLLLPCPS